MYRVIWDRVSIGHGFNDYRAIVVDDKSEEFCFAREYATGLTGVGGKEHQDYLRGYSVWPTAPSEELERNMHTRLAIKTTHIAKLLNSVAPVFATEEE